MWTAIGSMVVLFAASVFLRGFIGKEWAPLMQAPWWVLGPLIAAIQRRPKTETLHVEASPDGVRFGEKLLPRAKLKSALLRREADKTFVLLRGTGAWGTSADVAVKDDDEADRLCSALGLDAKSTVAEFTMQRQRNAGVPALVMAGAAMMASFVAIKFHAFHALLYIFIAALIGLATLIPLLIYAQRINVRVGADGIVVRDGFAKRRFISHADIASVSATGQTVWIGLKSGEKLQFDVGTRTKNATQSAELEVQGRSIAWRIEKARQAYQALAGEAPQAALALDRGGKTVREWVDQLRRVGQGANATFRDVGLTREQLLAVVESTSAAAKERLAAVVALREGLTEEEKPRIRVAADRCVEPAMRERMVRVAFAPDEELIEALSEERDDAARG